MLYKGNQDNNSYRWRAILAETKGEAKQHLDVLLFSGFLRNIQIQHRISNSWWTHSLQLKLPGKKIWQICKEAAQLQAKKLVSACQLSQFLSKLSAASWQRGLLHSSIEACRQSSRSHITGSTGLRIFPEVFRVPIGIGVVVKLLYTMEWEDSDSEISSNSDSVRCLTYWLGRRAQEAYGHPRNRQCT